MFWFCLSCRKTTVNLIQTTAGIEKRVTALEAEMDEKAEKDDLKELENNAQQLQESVQDRFPKLKGMKVRSLKRTKRRLKRKYSRRLKRRRLKALNQQHLYKRQWRKSKSKREGNAMLCYLMYLRVNLPIMKQEDSMILKCLKV